MGQCRNLYYGIVTPITMRGFMCNTTQVRSGLRQDCLRCISSHDTPGASVKSPHTNATVIREFISTMTLPYVDYYFDAETNIR